MPTSLCRNARHRERWRTYWSGDDGQHMLTTKFKVMSALGRVSIAQNQGNPQEHGEGRPIGTRLELPQHMHRWYLGMGGGGRGIIGSPKSSSLELAGLPPFLATRVGRGICSICKDV